MSLWRHRDFLVLWSGRTLSEVGDAVCGDGAREAGPASE
jgi:hypothetical protein